MVRLNVLVAVLGISFFCSCAGMGILSTARSEFDSGYALFSQGKYAQAVPYFRKAAEMEPTYAKAYLYLGRSYLATGKFVEGDPAVSHCL